MMRHHRLSAIVLGSAAALLVACGGSQPPAPVSAPTATPAPSDAAHLHPAMAGDGSPAEIAWTAPASWIEETPSSAMRRAQYRIPPDPADSEGGECAVFYFGAGQGGDVQGNVERWTGQFTTADGGPAQAKVSEVATPEVQVTRVEVSGTYHPTAMGGGSSAPRPGYMLLGAIVPGAEANWFIRCSGPETTLGRNRSQFDGLVGSLRRTP